MIIADQAKVIVKLKPEEFFAEVYEKEKTPKYQWTGVFNITCKNETTKKVDETKGLFLKFFSLLVPQKALILIFLYHNIYTFLGILGAFYSNELLYDFLPNAVHKKPGSNYPKILMIPAC